MGADPLRGLTVVELTEACRARRWCVHARRLHGLAGGGERLQSRQQSLVLRRVSCMPLYGCLWGFSFTCVAFCDYLSRGYCIFDCSVVHFW